MTQWITIIGLILIGLGLIVIEIILVPGTTVVGILGFIASIVGVWLSFEYFDAQTGYLVLAGTAVVFGISLYLGFKSEAWKRFTLKGSIDSKVNEGLLDKLTTGDTGKSLSVLKPIGKAEFGDDEYEVRSYGSYIEEGTEIQIEKIESNTIYVKPII